MSRSMIRHIAIPGIATLLGGSLLAAAAPAPPAPPAPIVVTESKSFESPVAFFRKLLKQDDPGRARALGSRTERSRLALLAKVREYEALSPETRELKLRTTELRWYLKTLLPMQPDQRAVKLAQMPERDRELVAVRLKQWNLLSPGWRDEILRHERTMDWIRRNELSQAPTSPDAGPDARLVDWGQLPRETRDGMIHSFNRFFQLSDSERDKILAAVPADRRETVAPALEKLNALPAAKRSECMSAFQKIAAMPEQERQRFFHKAEQWRQMTAAERETWINLVTKFPPMPPLPPGLAPKAPQMPPVPSLATERGIIYPPLPPGLDLPTMPPLPLLTQAAR